MPLYEYQCPKCGRFEVIRKFSDAPLTACPTCGAEVHKLASAPAIQFKGTGWYVTDYARKSSGSAKGETKGGESKGGESKGGESKGGESKDAGGSASTSKESAKGSSTPGSK